MSETPVECAIKESGKCIGWACPTCGNLYTPHMFGQIDTSDGYCERMARECCTPKKCDTCGEECELHRTRCWPCQSAKSDAKELAAYEAAPKITLDEYLKEYPDGMLTDGGEEFVSAGDYIPANWRHVWCCKPERGISLDAADICENAMSDRHEGAVENLDVFGLQKVLDEWCAAQKTCSWFQSEHALHPDDVARFRDSEEEVGDDLQG